MFFKYLASKNQPPGYYISGTSVENGFMIHSKILHLARRNWNPESNAGIQGIYIVQIAIVSVFIGNSCM